MRLLISLFLALAVSGAQAATTVPTDAQMPGTQPEELPKTDIGSFDSAKQCSFCHGSYDKNVEPQFTWQGSMMSHAGRDPIFWATLAVAEQDFDGGGDICLRCHVSNAWLSGRSVPTDGSAVTKDDANGIECDTCHRMTDPSGLEYKGIQNYPFIANDKQNPPTGYYGAAQYVMWPGVGKLGPYLDSETKHPSLKSKFHRSPDFCGTCHDVSNPVTGDLAHNNGAQFPLRRGTFSGVPGSPVEGKAAFNNYPYQYGIVERTYSEFKASNWPTFRVADYSKLPEDLKAGAIKMAYDQAIIAGKNGDYEDGTPRFYTCQTCHLPPVEGKASSTIHNKPKHRKDMPRHDLTGGNYWMPQAIQYLDTKGKLQLGGGLTPIQIEAMNAGIERAKQTLRNAASLTVHGNQLKVTNLTGHKLISGYPEGRRMWLNMKWYNKDGKLVREDGAYGPLSVNLNGKNYQVRTLLDLKGSNTRIYEVHGSMTRRWAQQLLGMGKPKSMPLSFDRVTGEVKMTLGQLADSSESYHETFHFLLNNYVAKDNRIPPYGMRYVESAKRNSLPVPFCQFGCPSPTGTFEYFDKVTLNPPSGAVNATISLMYQPTSWEYIQFLFLANNRSNPKLADAGYNILDAWLNTGMAEPYTMVSTTWTGGDGGDSGGGGCGKRKGC